jgi:novel protein kinase C delta type
VFLGELKSDNTYFAIKALKKDVVLEDNDIDCTLLEKKVLELGSECPYLTYLHSAFQTEVSNCFVVL